MKWEPFYGEFINADVDLVKSLAFIFKLISLAIRSLEFSYLWLNFVKGDS